jgi:6,7-dimethyl-8-ribityllumazine synthase
VVKVLEGMIKAEGLKIGVVTSRFNWKITGKLESGALDALSEAGFSDDQVVSIRVPGAVEAPLAAKWLLDEKAVDGVVVLGAVIRGETTHYDYVCNSAERGCTELQLQYGKPVTFGILTTENAEQAYARTIGRKGNKGAEAALTTVEMLSLYQGIKG